MRFSTNQWFLGGSKWLVPPPFRLNPDSLDGDPSEIHRAEVGCGSMLIVATWRCSARGEAARDFPDSPDPPPLAGHGFSGESHGFPFMWTVSFLEDWFYVVFMSLVFRIYPLASRAKTLSISMSALLFPVINFKQVRWDVRKCVGLSVDTSQNMFPTICRKRSQVINAKHISDPMLDHTYYLRTSQQLRGTHLFSLVRLGRLIERLIARSIDWGINR